MSLLSIGEFATASRLSPKALRLYDELGLLVPERVDPETGYRWYAPGQLEQARVVAALRRIGVPLARIKDVLALDEKAAARGIAAFWSEAEVEHAARRELVVRLVRRMSGKRESMYEVGIRRVPERKVLSLLRRMHQDEMVAKSRELFLVPLREAGVPRIEGPDKAVGAPYVIYHGEVSADSDGPIEWCRPVPDEDAEEFAARFPQFQLRTEPAHEEAFVHRGMASTWSSTDAELAMDALREWAVQNRREPAGGVRVVFIHNPANGGAGPDGEFAVPLQ